MKELIAQPASRSRVFGFSYGPLRICGEMTHVDMQKLGRTCKFSSYRAVDRLTDGTPTVIAQSTQADAATFAAYCWVQSFCAKG